jgi:hypothetical protein
MDQLTFISLVILTISIGLIIWYYYFKILPVEKEDTTQLAENETNVNKIIEFMNKLAKDLSTETNNRTALQRRVEVLEAWTKNQENDKVSGSLAQKTKIVTDTLYGTRDPNTAKFTNTGLLWKLGMIFGNIDNNGEANLATNKTEQRLIYPYVPDGFQAKFVRVFRNGLDSYKDNILTINDSITVNKGDINEIGFETANIPGKKNFNNPNDSQPPVTAGSNQDILRTYNTTANPNP